MLPTHLPDPTRLRLDLLRVDSATITVLMATTPSSSACPLCGTASSRVHSRYVQTLADLSWHGVAVSVQLTVRRFVCETAIALAQSSGSAYLALSLPMLIVLLGRVRHSS